jgi:peptidoglycan/xylan/chitin deacetylase (PgdA/CDA1 family)
MCPSATSEEHGGYTVVLTHDLDLLSLRELPWRSRILWGMIYRCTCLNLAKALKRNLPLRKFLSGILFALKLPAVRLGIGRDPVDQATDEMIELERRLGVRSTLYAIPFGWKAGFKPDGASAPASRACYYELARYGDWLKTLEADGWEIGLHSLDGYSKPSLARAEKRKLQEILGHDGFGVRVHWLYHGGDRSYQIFHDVGFSYDSTPGWNEKVGWPGGRKHPWKHASGIWVLPLNIQDGALLTEAGMNLSELKAKRVIAEMFEEAKSVNGVVTVLWHNHSFGAPRQWGDLYDWLIRRCLSDGAKIMTANGLIGELESKSLESK